MEINKQLFEDVLSGKLKGKFVLRSGSTFHSSLLSKIADSRYPYMLDSHSYTSEGILIFNSKTHPLNIEDFIPDTDMKENELTIEIPDGKIVDWDESKKQNKIVLKDKQLTYEEMCDKLFPKSGTYYFVNNHGNISTASSMCNPYISNPNSATTAHQLACLLAKNKLANVCKFLNGDIDYSIIESCWGFDLVNKMIKITYYRPQESTYYQPQFVCKSKELAEQAIEILGEETVKLALEPLGV